MSRLAVASADAKSRTVREKGFDRSALCKVVERRDLLGPPGTRGRNEYVVAPTAGSSKDSAKDWRRLHLQLTFCQGCVILQYDRRIQAGQDRENEQVRRYCNAMQMQIGQLSCGTLTKAAHPMSSQSKTLPVPLLALAMLSP